MRENTQKDAWGRMFRIDKHVAWQLTEGGFQVILLRHVIGEELRRMRRSQGRTLREVSSGAQISLGYLSEVERGTKEASSELLSAICAALGVPLSDLLVSVTSSVVDQEATLTPSVAA